MITETGHGTGAISKRRDLRDHRFLGKASIPFDWSTGYDVEKEITQLTGKSFTLATKDQFASSSCGGQAGSYLAEVLTTIQNFGYDVLHIGDIPKSAKYVYSPISYPGGGTTLRDILNLLVKKGVSYETLVPSYRQNGTTDELWMTDKTYSAPTIDHNAILSKQSSYGFINPTIEDYAQAIRDNHGAILEMWGYNNGTWRSKFPKPPMSYIAKNLYWNHFLFAGGAEMIGNKKYIKVKNSWGDNVGERGWQWIGEDHFREGMVQEGGFIYGAPGDTIKEQSTNSWKAKLMALFQLILGPTKLPVN